MKYSLSLSFSPVLLVLLSFLFAANTVFAAPETVLKPSEDPFYQPPDNYESAEVGQVLKFRKSPHQLRSIYVTFHTKNAYQYMYRTTNALGKPSYAVSLLMEPFNANNSRLVQYSIAEDSSSVDCSASYTFQKGASMTTIVGQAESLLLQAPLFEGYWVNTADYEGPNAAFTAGRMAGHANLDAIRGALSLSNQTGLSPDAEIVLWGYSGGALATGWASALQPTYAPELSKQILGAAMGGLPANITYTVLVADGSAYAGFIPAGVNGFFSEYPNLLKYLPEAFPSKFNWLINKAKNSCLFSVITYLAYAQILQGPHRMSPMGLGLFQYPEVRDTLRNSTLGVYSTEVPTIPVFIYHGLKDNIVPSNNTFDTYKYWCADNISSMEVSISNKTRHITEAILGAPAGFTWIKDRFNHKDNLVKGCQLTYRKTNLSYPGITKNTLELFEGIAKTIFGFKIGPSSKAKRSNDFEAEDFDYDFDDHVEKLIKEENHKLRKRGMFDDLSF